MQYRALAVVLLFAGCAPADDVDTPEPATTPQGVAEIRFDSYKADAPPPPTTVIDTPLGTAEGEGPVLELVVTDVWGRLPDARSSVTLVHEDGHGVRLIGYVEPVLVRLEKPGRYRVTAEIPEHLPETLFIEVDENGNMPIPEDTALHWSFSNDPREVGGRPEKVYGLFMGVEHRWFAASGPAPSRGNRVELFDNGRDAFAALAGDLDEAHQTVHLSFWLLRAWFELRRDERYTSVSESDRRAEAIITRLRETPAHVRLLLNQFWGRADVTNDVAVLDDEVVDHARDPRDGLEVMLQANETEVPYYDSIPVNDGEWSYRERLLEVYPEWAERGWLNEEVVRPAVYDREVHWSDLKVASYHQKMVTVDGRVGFLGGMNMNWADWDTDAHAVYDPLRMPIDASADARREVEAGLEPSEWGPRRDYMTRVEGPVVDDIEALFQKRWDLGIMRQARYSDDATPFHRDVTRQPVDRESGVQAQLTVTMPMPFWEHSILESTRRAIEGAEQFIYIEDQYFRAPIINELIRRRMEQVPTLRLIVVTKPVAYADPGRKWTAKSDQVFADAFPGRYLLLTMRASDFRKHGDEVVGTFADVDIHSKMLIVDDHIMSVGSCNKNNRGFIYEGEANLVIRDADFVAEHRRRIWERLVGDRYAHLVADPAQAFDLFDALSERNQRVWNLWDEYDGALPAEHFQGPGHEPDGLLYPLEVPNRWWFDVGPDFS